MQVLRIGAVALLVTVAMGWWVGAEEKPAAKSAEKDSSFEKIKSLKGDWEITRSPGEHGDHGGAVSYKVTAAGSVVQETLFGGTDHEMITMFYMDGDKLALTHYCMLQNRPYMLAEPKSSGDKIVFKCQDGKDKKLDAEDHMHQVTFTFVDADHVKAEWILYKSGKTDSTHSFEFARKKK